MNQYLLLRDNKQSGPYTAEQLSGMGLKAYDLVWLEGKSAAWRYPGEMEELKAFAPAVEEQPFDRFYKKPEAVRSQETEIKKDNHSRFEPKIAERSAVVPQASGKVYINFPGTQKKREATPVSEIKSTLNESLANNITSEHITPVGTLTPVKKKTNNLFYAMIAAAIVAIVFVSYLVINFNKQRQDIRQLNLLVKQLEENNNQHHAAQTSNNILPDQIPPANVDENVTTAEAIEKQEIKPVGTAKRNLSKQESPTDPTITFTESKPSTVNPAEKNEEPVTPARTSNENLFNLVSVKPNDYKVGVLGGISNLQLELTNNSLQSLHKVAIEIKYLGPEKRVIKTQTVYFENVAPGAQSTINIPKSSRGVSIDYTVTDIKS